MTNTAVTVTQVIEINTRDFDSVFHSVVVGKIM